jgi:hypothetical protein
MGRGVVEQMDQWPIHRTKRGDEQKHCLRQSRYTVQTHHGGSISEEEAFLSTNTIKSSLLIEKRQDVIKGFLHFQPEWKGWAVTERPSGAALHACFTWQMQLI